MTVKFVNLSDAARPDWSVRQVSRPVNARVWIPDEAQAPYPLVVLSHGTGGAAEDLDWLAVRLNQAGFLVAGVDHHGNTYNGDYLAEGFAFTWERPRDVTVLLDHVISAYDIDAKRIGAAGFSIGGFTVAALLGARTDPKVVHAVLTGRIPEPALPEFPNLSATIRESYTGDVLKRIIGDGAGALSDDRVKAGFAIAPAIAGLLDPSSLAAISRPLEVRWGDTDDITPPEDNALVYVESIPTATGRSVGAKVGHYDFLGDRDDPFDARSRVADEAAEFFVEML